MTYNENPLTDLHLKWHQETHTRLVGYLYNLVQPCTSLKSPKVYKLTSQVQILARVFIFVPNNLTSDKVLTIQQAMFIYVNKISD